MTVCSRRKNELTSVSASLENPKPTKKPFFRFVRAIAASNWSMSGRPTLSRCFTWIGYYSTMNPSSALSASFGAEPTGMCCNFQGRWRVT
jgi:hypothetical protein